MIKNNISVDWFKKLTTEEIIFIRNYMIKYYSVNFSNIKTPENGIKSMYKYFGKLIK